MGDTTKTGNRDRKRLAGGEDREVVYLTQQTGVSAEHARELIRAYGNDRDKLMKAAKGLAQPRVRSSRL